MAAGSAVAMKRSNVRGAKGPCHLQSLQRREGKDEMTKASIDLQDLRRRIYVKAKAEPSWRFWGLYVHVCKMETLRAAYEMAKQNDGAPGIDGVTFEAIEARGVEALLEQLGDELTRRTYKPLPARKHEIPKDGGKVRVLSIPAIRDRVVQGALKLILEPVFEADFQPGSFGYRPKRTAHDAIKQVADAIVRQKTRVLDFDLRAYFDNVRHDRLLEKVAQRVNDADVMRLLRVMLKASGKKGVPQGGVISPLLSNIYLNEVDRMLERAREVTRNGKYTYIEYARFADDLVILIDAYKRHDWLIGAVERRLREEFGKLQVEINDEMSRIVVPPNRSQPIQRVINLINPVLREWVNYFAVGHSSENFSLIKDWVEKKVRRQLAHAQKRKGFGSERWSRPWPYDTLGLFNGYRVRRDRPKVVPAG